METINDLLKVLNNKVPASISKRLDGLRSLNEKLYSAKKEHSQNPTEESQEKLSEIIDFIQDTQDDLIDDLKELVNQKREQEAKNIQLQRNRAEEQERIKQLDLKKQREEQKKQAEQKQVNSEAETKTNVETNVENEADPKKKSGIGWGGLVAGSVLLVLSAGAINYFGKRR